MSMPMSLQAACPIQALQRYLIGFVGPCALGDSFTAALRAGGRAGASDHPADVAARRAEVPQTRVEVAQLAHPHRVLHAAGSRLRSRPQVRALAWSDRAHDFGRGVDDHRPLPRRRPPPAPEPSGPGGRKYPYSVRRRKIAQRTGSRLRTFPALLPRRRVQPLRNSSTKEWGTQLVQQMLYWWLCTQAAAHNLTPPRSGLLLVNDLLTGA